MLYEELLKSFNEELKDIHLRISSPLEEANLVIALCTRSLAKLQKAVEKYGFKNIDKEIYFFKFIKVIPMQYLIYYTERRSCELSIPKGGNLFQMQFLEKLEEEVNLFFNKHKEFIVYLELEHSLLDKYYYTRKYLDKIQPIKTYPYYKNPNFNTSHDILLARIRGLGLFVNYINQRRLKLENRTQDFIEKNLIWTGPYSALVEMLYGCQSMGYFNNGNISTNQIIEAFCVFLNLKKGNSSRTYNEIKARKGSRIKFFDEAGKKLLDKMDEEDGLD